MPLVTQTFSFRHQIKWSIEKFNVIPPGEKWDITGPQFDIRLLDVVTLRFYLRILGPGEGMMLAVQPEGDVRAFTAQHPTLSAVTTISNVKGDKIFYVSDPGVTTSSLPAVNALPLVPPKDEETLVLTVTLETTVDQGRYWDEMLDPHLVTLSQDIMSLVYKPLNHDFYLSYKDPKKRHRTELDAHSSILRARMPCLFRKDTSLPNVVETRGTPDPKKGKNVVETDALPEVLRKAIYYLYGRLVTKVPTDQREEMLKFARTYDLKDLERMLSPYPVELAVTTRVIVEDFISNFVVDDVEWDNLKPILWSVVCRKLRKQGLTVNWTVTSSQSIVFSFEATLSDSQAPLYMRCNLVLRNKSNLVVQQFFSWFTFTKDDRVWTTPEDWVTKEVVEDLDLSSISYEVRVSEGKYEIEDGIEETKKEDPPGDLIVFNNLLNFRDQLKNLFLNQEGCDLDLLIGEDEEDVIRVHKAVVVARSPTIRAMMRELENASGDSSSVVEIDLEYFPLEHYRKVLIYMYSGIIDLDKEEEEDERFVHGVINVSNYLIVNFLEDYCYFHNIDRGLPA